jgi:transposase-like protein
MARPRGSIEVVCQNPQCDFYLTEKGKDIIKRGRDAKTRRQRYYCIHCGKFFMETKGTPLFNKKLPESEIINICKHFVEKNGIRSVERLTGHHRDTIGHLLSDIAEQAERMNNFLIHDVKLSPIECDEFWSFVKKKKRTLSDHARNQISLATRGSLPA